MQFYCFSLFAESCSVPINVPATSFVLHLTLMKYLYSLAFVYSTMGFHFTFHAIIYCWLLMYLSSILMRASLSFLLLSFSFPFINANDSLEWITSNLSLKMEMIWCSSCVFVLIFLSHTHKNLKCKWVDA